MGPIPLQLLSHSHPHPTTTGWAPCFIRQLPTSYLLYTVVYICQYYLLSLSHPLLLLGFPGGSEVKMSAAMRKTPVWSLVREDPLEKEMATHSSILAWRIPWMEEPGRLQSMGSQRVGHDWTTSLSLFFLLLLLCPQVCSVCLHLYSFPAGPFISTIFLDSILYALIYISFDMGIITGEKSPEQASNMHRAPD